MKVFLSWSGEVSHKVAIILREWLPNVLQAVDPYVSSEDIDKGARWSTDIANELEAASYGILCVTEENMDAPWLNFEAGALSKIIEKSRVSPFLFALKRSDVKTGPILQFQSTISEKEDVKKLVQSINEACHPASLDDSRLAKVFEVWWPELEKSLLDLQMDADKKPVRKKADHAPSKEAEILEEVLGLIRQQNRIINDPSTLLPPTYISSLIGRSERFDGHPVFEELAHLWIALVEQAKRARGKTETPDAIFRSIDRLEGPITYILERFGRASFRSRKLSVGFSEETSEESGSIT